MNRYRHRFMVGCPVNGIAIRYRLTVWTEDKIMVEDIVKACKAQAVGFHEEIADRLHHRFGGRQVLRAHHHGVDIRTIRGA